MTKKYEISESSILRTLRTGVVVHAADTRIIYSNPRAAELLGMTEDEILGRVAVDPAWRFLDEEGKALPVAAYPISKVLATQQGFEGMVLGIDSPMHAECIWVSVSATPFFDADDLLTHVCINFHDVSKQKTLELALRRQTYRNQIFLRSAGDGMCVMDAQGHVVEASDSFCTMLDYPRERIIGMHVSEWDTAFSENELAAIVKQTIADGKHVQFETQHLTRDGHVFHVEVSAVPFVLDDQQLIHCSTRNITERKVSLQPTHL